MYTKNRRGPSTVSCGTLNVTAAAEDDVPSRITCWNLSARKLSIHDRVLCLIP